MDGEKFIGSCYYGNNNNLKLFNGDHQGRQHSSIVCDQLYDHFNSYNSYRALILDGDDHELAQQDICNEEHTMFWKSQQALLEEILALYHSNASRSREVITKHIYLARETHSCECLEPKLDYCVKCSRQRVVNLLCKANIKATLCTSMWKKTHKIPGGKHEYIEVTLSTKGRMKQVCLLIEIEFRDQFKMAKSCEEYRKLIDRLPEVYIGKPEHLNAMIGVVCDAAKRSTSEKRMHLGPWRKRSFMQQKWSSANSHHHHHHDERSLMNNQPQSSTTTHQLGLLPPEEDQLETVRKDLQFSKSTATAMIRVA